MKLLLVLSVVLCAAVTVRAAAVVPAEAAAVQQENKPPSKSAALPEARARFCLDGWHEHGGKCYYLGNIHCRWSDAVSYCARYGGTLASVHDIWDYNFLQGIVKTGDHTFAWIGGYNFQGVWRWQDGSAFNHFNWEGGSPSGHPCLQLNSHVSIGWSDQDCTINQPFVCEVNPKC